MLWRIVIYFEERWEAAEHVMGDCYVGRRSSSEQFSDLWFIHSQSDRKELLDTLESLSLNNVREPMGAQLNSAYEDGETPTIVYIGGQKFYRATTADFLMGVRKDA